MDEHDDLMRCACCRQPVILTVEAGLCPRCFYRLECEAICAAAECEMERVFEDRTASMGQGVSGSEPAWSW